MKGFIIISLLLPKIEYIYRFAGNHGQICDERVEGQVR